MASNGFKWCTYRWYIMKFVHVSSIYIFMSRSTLSSSSKMVSGVFGVNLELCALARRVGLSSCTEASSRARFLPLDALGVFTVSAVFSFRRPLQTKGSAWITRLGFSACKPLRAWFAALDRKKIKVCT